MRWKYGGHQGPRLLTEAASSAVQASPPLLQLPARSEGAGLPACPRYRAPPGVDRKPQSPRPDRETGASVETTSTPDEGIDATAELTTFYMTGEPPGILRGDLSA
ncbi:unnamed protein product [Tetraodon nigroviridis]|uniref:(spotted green pufferfish) hypothetical protein n=1 Tax=Tetraodon nigroviridis TaxID=99883 RepID=Q4SF26_TETNG|nr:unnamed protein product [Tetraodon nigroviridis]